MVLHADLLVTVSIGKRRSLSRGHGDAYVTFCHFGYEVFSEKTNKHAKENKTAVYFFDWGAI